MRGGRGYATRAAILLTRWLFDLGAARVFLTIVAGNEESVAVARRAGFVYEGTMRAVRPTWCRRNLDSGYDRLQHRFPRSSVRRRDNSAERRAVRRDALRRARRQAARSQDPIWAVETLMRLPEIGPCLSLVRSAPRRPPLLCQPFANTPLRVILYKPTPSSLGLLQQLRGWVSETPVRVHRFDSGCGEGWVARQPSPAEATAGA
jgi:hypothetical protein